MGRRETSEARAASLNILNREWKVMRFTVHLIQPSGILYTCYLVVVTLKPPFAKEELWGTRYSTVPCQADSHRIAVHSTGHSSVSSQRQAMTRSFGVLTDTNCSDLDENTVKNKLHRFLVISVLRSVYRRCARMNCPGVSGGSSSVTSSRWQEHYQKNSGNASSCPSCRSPKAHLTDGEKP